MRVWGSVTDFIGEGGRVEGGGGGYLGNYSAEILFQSFRREAIVVVGSNRMHILLTMWFRNITMRIYREEIKYVVVKVVMVVVVAFSSAREDFGRIFDTSYPACAF